MKNNLVALLLMLPVSFAWSAEVSSEGPVLPEGYAICKSAEEFEKSVAYFRSEKSLGLNDNQVIKWSLKISKGCSGATDRFKKIYELLQKSGVDLRKCVEMAALYSERSAEQTQSFANLFKVFFLDNYFDLDFQTAFDVSTKLSANPAKADFARKDFESLFKFCTDSDKLGLPLRSCAEYSLQLLENYDFFPEGIFHSFEKTFNFVNKDAKAILNIKEALDITRDVLSNGPLAPDNFIAAYKYSIAKSGLDISAKQGMRVALEIAKSSMIKKAP